jgi:hypothetical protein
MSRSGRGRESAARRHRAIHGGTSRRRLRGVTASGLASVGGPPHSGIGLDPGGVSVQVSGVWPGGRLPSQVSFSRLNHDPSADVRTAESTTATGYFANLPSAQLGTHWFSQSVPCPAAEAVQSVQVRPSIRRPASAHVSTIDDGCLLSVCGSALAQSATTPTSATGAAELGAVVGAFVGPVVGPVAAPVGEAAAALPVGAAVTAVPVGETATAEPVGALVTVDVELFLTVPLGPE